MSKLQEIKEKPVKEKKSISEVVPSVRSNKKQQKQLANASVVAAPNINGVPPPEKEKENEMAEKPVEAVSVPPPLQNGIVGNPGKEKKKKKSEYNTMQQLSKSLKIRKKL